MLPPALDQALRDWRDFYMLSGGAAATLVGLMFVAASIASGTFARRGPAPMRVFITPTVVHFASSLFVCLISIMPSHNARSLGGVIGVGALAGLAYCGRVVAILVRRFASGLDWEDRAFYALIPISGYLLLLVSSALEFDERPDGANLAAAIGVIVLIVAGLRNAWDMTVWITTRPPDAPPPEIEGT
jgi:hypothetical protein